MYFRLCIQMFNKSISYCINMPLCITFLFYIEEFLVIKTLHFFICPSSFLKNKGGVHCVSWLFHDVNGAQLFWRNCGKIEAFKASIFGIQSSQLRDPQLRPTEGEKRPSTLMRPASRLVGESFWFLRIWLSWI